MIIGYIKMDGLDKSWMMFVNNRGDPIYEKGVDAFLEYAFHADRTNFRHGQYSELIQCPCRNCRNGVKLTRTDVEIHLKVDGVWTPYTNWVCHGETPFHSMVRDQTDIPSVDMGEQQTSILSTDMLHDLQQAECVISGEEQPNSKAKDFYKLLEDAETPLYDGCQKISKLSFLLKLLNIKTMNQVTGKCMNMLLEFIKEILPEGANVPGTWYEVKKLIKDLGLGYQKIHACQNDCLLFWKEHEGKDRCPQCDAPRYKETEQNVDNQIDSEKLNLGK
jgi:hypothetical protein